jgi:hypothetical protein
VALIGALTFGTDVDEDKFANTTASNYLYVFPPSHIMVTILRFGLVFSITLLFAVINFPMLEAVEGVCQLLPIEGSDAWLHNKRTRRRTYLFHSFDSVSSLLFLVLVSSLCCRHRRCCGERKRCSNPPSVFVIIGVVD